MNNFGQGSGRDVVARRTSYHWVRPLLGVVWGVVHPWGCTPEGWDIPGGTWSRVVMNPPPWSRGQSILPIEQKISPEVDDIFRVIKKIKYDNDGGEQHDRGRAHPTSTSWGTWVNMAWVLVHKGAYTPHAGCNTLVTLEYSWLCTSIKTWILLFGKVKKNQEWKTNLIFLGWLFRVFCYSIFSWL